MKTIKEQAYGANWGIDLAWIQYPSVSSCMTLTYYFAGPTLLAGMHCGVHNGPAAGGGTISVNQIVQMHDLLLGDSRIKGARPVDAVLVGDLASWRALSEQLATLHRIAERMLGRAVAEETIPACYKSSNIDFHVSNDGFFAVASNAEPTYRYRTARPWSPQ